MFTTKELRLINDSYFNILRCPIEENFIEFQSKNTKDCWILLKPHSSYSEYPIIVYHKHPGQMYYHKHWQCYKVWQSIKSIKEHDEYSKTRKWREK